jgi:TolB-like protein/Tfp pilus assembly protein PilF
VAVLPFANMSGDPAKDYFSDGFSAELLNDLASDPRLFVAARTSAFAFRGRSADIAAIASTLHVHAIVEGSVREEGNRVRIDAELIDAQKGYDIWSAHYDRNLADILNVQDEVAHAVAFALTTRLLGDGPPRIAPTHAPINADAYHRYLEARSLLDKRTNDGDANAVRLFKQVADVEPRFAPAYAGLGRAYVHMAQFHDQRADILAAAETSLKTALRIDPRNIEAMSERLLLSLMKWDWNQAADDARSLERLNSHSVYAMRGLGIYYGSLGFLEQESALMREATRLDPLSFVDLNNIAVVYYDRGEYVEAASAAVDALALRPDRPLTLFTLCAADVGMRYAKDAESLIARLSALHESDASRGCALKLAAAAGKTGEAHRIADAIAGRFPTFVFSEADVGAFYLAADDPTKALQWFERAYDKRDYDLFAYSSLCDNAARVPGHARLEGIDEPARGESVAGGT